MPLAWSVPKVRQKRAPSTRSTSPPTIGNAPDHAMPDLALGLGQTEAPGSHDEKRYAQQQEPAPIGDELRGPEEDPELQRRGGAAVEQGFELRHHHQQHHHHGRHGDQDHEDRIIEGRTKVVGELGGLLEMLHQPVERLAQIAVALARLDEAGAIGRHARLGRHGVGQARALADGGVERLHEVLARRLLRHLGDHAQRPVELDAGAQQGRELAGELQQILGSRAASCARPSGASRAAG